MTGSGGASRSGVSADSTFVAISVDSPSSVVRYGLTSALGSAAFRRGLGRRPRRPGRRRSFMSSGVYWVMCAKRLSLRRTFSKAHRAFACQRANCACTHATGARRFRILCGTGTIVPLRTTVRESPRGAESARDTGDVHLGKAMVGHATPIVSGCHSPEPRAVRATHRSPTAVRVSHQVRIRAS